MIKPLIETKHELPDGIRLRWSGRAFDRRPVEQDKVERMFEAVRWAASSYNDQPWKFIVVDDSTTAARSKVLDCIYDTNRIWAKDAPMFIVTIVRKDSTVTGLENKHAWHDMGLAIGNLSFIATEEGLNMHQMGGFDAAMATELFELPESYEPVSIIAIGYRKSPEDLPELLQQKEVAAQQRKPLEDFVFKGEWGNPLT